MYIRFYYIGEEITSYAGHFEKCPSFAGQKVLTLMIVYTEEVLSGDDGLLLLELGYLHFDEEGWFSPSRQKVELLPWRKLRKKVVADMGENFWKRVSFELLIVYG